MSLSKHPGFFGLTSKGVFAIHANWPMYPEEHGSDLALLWLTAFPNRTCFSKVDDIDRCILLMAELKVRNEADLFDEKNLHVAIWHEDLLELKEKGFIDGVSPISERQWEENKRADLPKGPLYIKLDDGRLQEVTLPSLDEYDDEDNSWLTIAKEGFVVTEAGRKHMAFVLSVTSFDLTILGQRIPPLLALGFFDTAVREASLGIEHHIKNWLKSGLWGERLIQEFISQIRKDDDHLNTQLHIARGQIRMALMFIRNDFMHNFVDVDEIQCYAILFRLLRVQTIVNLLINPKPN